MEPFSNVFSHSYSNSEYMYLLYGFPEESEKLLLTFEVVFWASNDARFANGVATDVDCVMKVREGGVVVDVGIEDVDVDGTDRMFDEDEKTAAATATRWSLNVCAKVFNLNRRICRDTTCRNT